ncbi:MAG: YihY/virulence factor BrkB family protein [Nibricoccus sp.]
MSVFVTAVKAWFADNSFKHSAAVSYYTLFSMAPITIIALAIAGFFFGEEAARGQLSHQLTQLIGRQGAEALQGVVAQSEPQTTGWASTAVGVGLLLLGATSVMAQLQESVNELWRVVSRPERNVIWSVISKRMVSFAMVVSVGLLLIVSLVLSTTITTVVRYFGTNWSPYILRIADLASGFVINTLLFAMVFKVLPDVRLNWKDVWRGAMVTALLFEIGRFLIAFYLGHATFASTFAAAGSLVALLVWVYYSSAILFFGVEFVRADVAARGRHVPPSDSAVYVRQELVRDPLGTTPMSRENGLRKLR